jgi:hypothetical protein
MVRNDHVPVNRACVFELGSCDWVTHTNVGPVTTVVGLGDPVLHCATKQLAGMLSKALQQQNCFDTLATVSLPACIAGSIAASHGSVSSCAAVQS